MQESAEEARVYEVGYLFVPTIADEKIAEKVESVRSAVEGASGRIISEGSPSLLDLAYPMSTVVSNKKHTYESGYFGWVKFDAEPASIGAIKDVLDGNSDIIRHIIIKTVREDTMTIHHPPHVPGQTEDAQDDGKTGIVERSMEETKAPKSTDDKEDDKKTKKEELSSEEIDETIDKLVID